MQAMMTMLSDVHYHPDEINDDFSEKVYDLYLKRLDFSKKFLTKDDIAKLSKYKYLIDDEIKANSYEFFDVSYDMVTKRIDEAKGYVTEILASPFDFTVNESEELDPKQINFPTNSADLKNEWRKYLKYETMTRISDEMDARDKAKANKDTSYHEKFFTQMEEDARKKR